MANLKPLQCLNLDKNQQRNFIKFFHSLGKKPKTTVRIFDRNDFYSLHAEDAELAARMVFKSTASMKIMSVPGDDEDIELPYTVLSKNNFENFVRELLLVKNYRVEVYANKGGSKNDWKIELKGSPGNVIQFEDILFGNNEQINTSAIMALQLKKENQLNSVGLSCIETTDRIFSLIEIVDDDFFTELEAIVVLLGPKECLLPSKEGEYEKINALLERNGVLVTVRKRQEFTVSTSDFEDDLNRLLFFEKGQQENLNTVLGGTNKTFALQTLNVAIKYLDLGSDSSNFGHFQLKVMNLKRFVHLDAAAVSALNILPKPGTSVTSQVYRCQSILGVLDYCRTPQGRRLLVQWLKQPLKDIEAIKDRHDIVECFVESLNTRKEIHDDYLKRIPDIMMLTKKLMRRNASLQDVYKLYRVVGRVPNLLGLLSDLENSTVNNILSKPIRDTYGDLFKFKEMIEKILDMEGIEKGEYFIKPSFDEELQTMKEKMDEIEEKIRKELRKAANDLNLDEGSSIKLDVVSHIGYHFRISLKEDSVLRKNTKYRTIDAVKGGVRFTTDKLTDLNSEFSEVRESYEEQQKSIVDEVIRVVLGYLPPLTNLSHLIAQLDCFTSFAVAATSSPIPYVRPKMRPAETRVLNLKQVRHPCLEMQSDVNFIANDIDFRKDETQMYIITGPNMGGKSTFIRSVGSAVLLAHVGSFVPCDEAEISITDSILGRIGASDCIMKGLSTFMIEMIETSGIIRTATENSLVIIDELGRGTSTYDGCGIAWSIAEYLAKETKCFTLFATHFHEITELAQTVSTVKNSHLSAMVENSNFILLYQVKPGPMDNSFGIQVAKLADFPEDVVKLAQKCYDEIEDHFSNLKSNADPEAVSLFASSLEKLSDVESLEDITKIIAEVRGNVRKSGNEYFKSICPEVFQ
ncbi:DNA mismatch repair protein spellchecker 1 [Phlebotomus papatasi]|uniref:DNA mismatch repair protein spellchecker 1 n=1 Tax=Phlebotomus papatasi TaxID=29031 RepID=UPI002484618A|nr:DNA mismatch repair protein spellchecker 1 [Phlebotomus papatasi]